MELFGINGGELLIILIVALFLLGPSTIAQALRTINAGVTKLREYSARLREQSMAANTLQDLGTTEATAVWSELGASTAKLKSLDPRVMIREAVREEMDEWLRLSQTATQAAKPAPKPVQLAEPGKSESSPNGNDNE